jgi:hypothetical protein
MSPTSSSSSSPGRGDAALQRLQSDLAGQHHLAVDVSDLRACIALDLPEAREILAKLARPTSRPRLSVPATSAAPPGPARGRGSGWKGRAPASSASARSPTTPWRSSASPRRRSRALLLSAREQVRIGHFWPIRPVGTLHFRCGDSPDLLVLPTHKTQHPAGDDPALMARHSSGPGPRRPWAAPWGPFRCLPRTAFRPPAAGASGGRRP